MGLSHLRLRGAVFTVASGLIVATTVAAASVSVGQASRVQQDSKKTCNSKNPCLWYSNDGSGDGIAGGAAGDGAGLYGTNTENSKNGNGAGTAGFGQSQSGVYGSSKALDGVYGTAAGNGAGVYGTDTDSSKSGVGAGVAGVSQVQTGVYGSSRDSDGVYGTAAGNGAGLFGINTDKSKNGNGAGAAGESQSQTGVYGSSGSNVGGYFTSQNQIGVYGVSADAGHAGVYGENNSNGSGTGGAAGVTGISQIGNGVIGIAQNVSAGYFTAASTYPAIYAIGNNGSGSSSVNDNHTYAALYGEADDPKGGPLFVQNIANKLGFFVNSVGDGTFSGKVFATGFVKNLPTRGGGSVQSYAAKSTEDTVEDTGSGSIVRGRGIVRFDPNFARAIDASRGYRVLITPDGDNRGLFVSFKGTAGFAVREAQGGRSTLAFDYRVVAYPIGGDTARLPVATAEKPPLTPPHQQAIRIERPPLAPRLQAAPIEHPPLAPQQPLQLKP